MFRIGHLGDFNDLMLAGTLCGVEMGLALCGVPVAPIAAWSRRCAASRAQPGRFSTPPELARGHDASGAQPGSPAQRLAVGP